MVKIQQVGVRLMIGCRARRFSVAIILALNFSTSLDAAQIVDQAPRIVTYDMGGSLRSRQKEVRALRRTGQKIEIVGRCFSSCTMYLGLPGTCITPTAIFGFHGPRGLFAPLPIDAFDHWSRVMARSIGEPLDAWFMQRARHIRSGVIKVKGAALIDMGYQRC